MATLIQALAAFCPKIALGAPADAGRFLQLLTQRTALTGGLVKYVQDSEVETLIGLLNEGRAVHTGTAIFRPTIDLEGNISVSVRVDRRILEALNGSAFKGKITNSANIGKTSQEIADMWNKEHADDPVAPPSIYGPGTTPGQYLPGEAAAPPSP